MSDPLVDLLQGCDRLGGWVELLAHLLLDLYLHQSLWQSLILTAKLMKYGLNKWRVRCTKSWQNCWGHSVGSSDMKSSWRWLNNCLPQGSILGQYCATSQFLNWMMSRVHPLLASRWYKTGMSGWNTTGPCHCSERPGHRNLNKFSTGKCQILHLRRNNPMHQKRLGPGWLGSSFTEGPGG